MRKALQKLSQKSSGLDSRWSKEQQDFGLYEMAWLTASAIPAVQAQGQLQPPLQLIGLIGGC